jgi:hypothetical protein
VPNSGLSWKKDCCGLGWQNCATRWPGLGWRNYETDCCGLGWRNYAKGCCGSWNFRASMNFPG